MYECTFQVSDNQLFNALKAGEEWAWRMIYSQYKSQVTRFVIYHHGSIHDGDAVFREALLVFYEKVNSTSFHFNAKVGTYLLAITRNLWSKKLSARGKKLVTPRLFEQPLDFYENENFEVNQNTRVSRMVEAIENLGDRGKDMLLAWYFHKMSPEKIKEQLALENEEMAVVSKNEYLSHLKKMLGCRH